MENIEDIKQWLESKTGDWKLYLKRLSSNDTGLTGGHQVGVYVPMGVMRHVFPQLQQVDILNPKYIFNARVESHVLPEQELCATYYNSKALGTGTRNEQRITRWNTGVTGNPLQDVENTGALCLFAFHSNKENENADFLSVWLCQSVEEEEFVEGMTGEVSPGDWHFGNPDNLFNELSSLPATDDKGIEIPDGWKTVFPTGKEIVDFVIHYYPEAALASDLRLIKRRDREYSIFRLIEDEHVLHRIANGFGNVDEFIALANSVSNRRKSRSGNSLELHLEKIFTEQGLTMFGVQCITEAKKKPDFLFPSCEAYHDQEYSTEKLRMMAVKTTCKDRWRQILNEADRIDNPYLLTLQEGLSENQFSQMEREGVMLVVPESLHTKYPDSIRPKLLSLSQFIESTINLYK